MTLALNAERRDKTGKQVTHVRRDGLIPAVVYGKKQKSIPLSVKEKEMIRLYQEAGESTLVDLTIEKEKPIKILIHDFQVDPITQKPLHVDFYAVDMAQEIETEVELKFIGEPKAVKELGGIFVKNRDTMNIKCLPEKLIHELEIDISKLSTFDDKITFGDLTLPEGITIMEKPEVIVAFVDEPRSEEELKELDSAIEQKVEEVEVEEKGKPKEGEEGEAASEAGQKEEAKGKSEKKEDKK